MKIDQLISSCPISENCFPVEPFQLSQVFSLKEDYNGSNKIIDSISPSDIDLNNTSNIPLINAVTLYGWNLYHLKETEKLGDLLRLIPKDGFENFKELAPLKVRMLELRGDYEIVCSECSDFIEQKRNSLSPDLAHILLARMMSEYKLGRTELACQDAEIAHSLFRLLKDDLGTSWAANCLGLMARKTGEYRESIKWLKRSLETYEKNSLPRQQTRVVLNLGVTFYKIGDYGQSEKFLIKAKQFVDQYKWEYASCLVYTALGNLSRLKRNFIDAKTYIHIADKFAKKLKSNREQALVYEMLGHILFDEGNLQVGNEFFLKALELGGTNAPNGDIVRTSQRKIGEYYCEIQNPSLAFKHLNQSRELAQAQGDRFEEAVTLRVMSDTCIEIGDLKSARSYIDCSVETLREIDARHELAISLMKSADLTLQEMENGRSALPRLTQLNNAWNQATAALDLLIRVDVPWWTQKSRSQVGRIANMRTAQERADKHSAIKNNKAGGYDPGDVIIHTSGQMRDLLHLCDMFADSDEPVLITGETGTGKELIAKRIHQHSKRQDRHLVTVNLAAIPQTMFEREFFGHVKGAFSGADRDGEGYAARAHGGTLFLDEIGDLPLESQPKLLRLLQDGTYQAIGDPRQRHCDIRLVAATNSNLEKLVAEGKFRSDLYYRIQILDLELPPVRERNEDVLPLLRHFLSIAATRHVDLADYFNASSLEAIEQYEWPGNVRQIAMIARRAHVGLMSRGRVEINLPRDKDSSLVLSGPGLLALEATAGGPTQTPASSDASERSRILMALDEVGGNRNAAAKALGVGRSTLYRRMIKFGIPTRRT